MEVNILRGIFNMEKAKKLSEIRLTCLNYPLDREDLVKFYIDTSEARGVDMLRRLSLSFEYTPNIYQHVLYLGHRGSGKSTILYQLEQELKSTYKVIRFSVQDYLDVYKMDFVDILFVMYERIFSECSEYINDDEENYSILREIYDRWYVSIEKESTEEETASIGLEAEAGVGLSSKIINLFSKLTSSFKLGTLERTTVREKVSNCISEYIENLNKLVQIVAEKSGLPILIMFEDLEKIPNSVAKTLFIDQSDNFPRLKVRLLLTTPIHLKYSVEFRKVVTQYFTSEERCPMIAIYDANKERNKLGFETMRQIVHARVSQELIEKTALDAAISYSGGVIRDLFKMLCEASLVCEMDKRTTINEEDVNYSFSRLQEGFSDTINTSHIPVLKEVYNNPRGIISDSSIFVDLMCAEFIIEYNGEQWRGVHPAVVAYLQKRNLL